MPSSLKSISNVKNTIFALKSITPLPNPFTSTTITISNASHDYAFQNGNYISSSSSEYNTSYPSFLAYNGNISVATCDSWVSMDNSYDITTGHCITTTKTTLVDGTLLSGEWLGLKIPTPFILSAYSLFVRRVDMISINKNTGPTIWSIVASNTGTEGSWIQIHNQNVPSSIWHLNSVPILFNLFPIPVIAYSYYRIVVQTAGTQYPYLGIKQFNLMI